MKKLLCSFGVIAPIWLLIGVTIVGLLYPGYSHINQAMSELHAIGSPVENLSPIVNNYPLGILFIGFGIFVVMQFQGLWARASGVMVILHGIGTIIAGAFPCDVGCNPESTLNSQQIHWLGAVVMLVTFLIAPAIWGFLAKRLINAGWFGWFSGIVVVLQIALFPVIGHALETNINFGLYQRIAYGIPLVWLLILAILLFKNMQHLASEQYALLSE